VPSTSIDACLWDGFHLNNGVKITDGMGVLLVAGEAFAWSPWAAAGGNKQTRLINEKGQWDVGDDAWGVLGLVWPKPGPSTTPPFHLRASMLTIVADLLILGVGPSMAPISPSTRKFINSLGIRVEIQDTRNAAAQFNLLATERGVGSVAAALVPMGWREGVGVKSSGSK
jgi:NADH dehydrogenase [ubiquinone] 1 alpha subcomplex assembly factor 3